MRSQNKDLGTSAVSEDSRPAVALGEIQWCKYVQGDVKSKAIP
jgi:hypothetical protein